MGLLDHAASHLQDVKSLGILEEVCPTTAMIYIKEYYIGMALIWHSMYYKTCCPAIFPALQSWY